MSARLRSAAWHLFLLAVTVVLAAPSARAEEAPQWIVVTAPAFTEVVGPLCEHRRGQGFEVVRIEADSDAVGLQAHLAELCRKAEGRSYVLLVGTVKADEAATIVPALKGSIGRMRGEPSDNGYGCPHDDLLPSVAVGRFPARTADEVRAMVEKTIRFEEQRAPEAWRHHITLLVGHPGGSSKMQKRLAAVVVRTALGSSYREVHPQWTTRAIVHMPESPFYVPSTRLAARSLRYLQEGQLLSIYLGHSGAGGLSSDWTRFLTRADWAETPFGPDAGIFLSCGCFACQLQGNDGEGHGLAAIRNPEGPVAVVGAHGESYGAMGKLAFEGLLPLLAAREPPERLADWWLAIKRGLARGKIGRLMFLLYDRGDGSAGKVPLEVQRLEHLEMWMLLGDPALKLPLAPLEIDLDVEGEVRAGSPIVVRGTLPPRFASTPAMVQIAVERPFGTEGLDIEALPTEAGEARDRALLARHEQANDAAIARAEVEAKDGRFECRLTLPAKLPWKRLTLRARARTETGGARGARLLPIQR